MNRNNNLLNVTNYASLCSRYPEKTFYLGQVFNNTTNSYKLFWFLGLLSLIKRSSKKSHLLFDVLCEMVTIAWHPVCFFKLTLGMQDKLQDAIIEIKNDSGLSNNADANEVRKFINSSKDIQKRLIDFARYVPTRFLTPWFTERLRGKPDSKRDQIIERQATESQKTPLACPYYIDGNSKSKKVILNEIWETFIVDNLEIVQSFAEYHLSIYLQRRNPNVPGVINKLKAPTKRQLSSARKFYCNVKNEFMKNSKTNLFRDVYSNRILNDKFSIDHFLPWSFVTHDLLWNLVPVEKSTNSSKGDTLPNFEIYLPNLANLHRESIMVLKHKPKLLIDFVDCFKKDISSMILLSKEEFINKYREIMLPQAQIAMSQGFEADWVFKN